MCIGLEIYSHTYIILLLFKDECISTLNYAWNDKICIIDREKNPNLRIKPV